MSMRKTNHLRACGEGSGGCRLLDFNQDAEIVAAVCLRSCTIVWMKLAASRHALGSTLTSASGSELMRWAVRRTAVLGDSSSISATASRELKQTRHPDIVDRVIVQLAKFRKKKYELASQIMIACATLCNYVRITRV